MSGTTSTTAQAAAPSHRRELWERLTFPLRAPWRGPLPLAVALFLLFEIGVARGASPLAFLVFGGAAAWTYGLLAGLPVGLPPPGGQEGSAPARWKGSWSEWAGLAAGAFLALLAGLGAGALVAWATRT